MAVAFSSSGDNVMTRQIASSAPSSFTDVAEEFNVTSTATWIHERNFRRVCRTLIESVSVVTVLIFLLAVGTVSLGFVLGDATMPPGK